MPSKSSSEEEKENNHIINGLDLAEVQDFASIYPFIPKNDVPRDLYISETTKAKVKVASGPGETSGSRPDLKSEKS